MAEPQESEASQKITDTKAIGLIGAILITVIEVIPVTKAEFVNIKQAALTTVPFFSALISGSINWLWDCIKPQKADKIILRRALKKMEKEIKAKLRDPDIPENTKKELEKKLEEITLKHIDSFDSF